MTRKRNYRMQRPPVHPIDVVRANQPHNEEEVTKVMNLTRAALIRMLEGNANGQDAARLGRDINIAWVRTEQIGNNAEAQRRLEAAAEAVMEACRIFKKHGRYGLTGPARIALGHGVDVFEEIVRASTPLEMRDAEDVVVNTERRIRQQAKQTT